MERRQGFFSALQELSPARLRSHNTLKGAPSMDVVLMTRRRNPPELPLVARLGRVALAPLMEGPNPGDGEGECRKDGWAEWLWSQITRAPVVARVPRRSDLRLLLGVMGAPLAPIHACAGEPLPHLSMKDTPIEISSAHYILQQCTAASRGMKLMGPIHNFYAMGKMRVVASEFETASKVMKNQNLLRNAQSGGFILWQMDPEMWYVDLAVGAGIFRAGCNGKIVWRHTPWLGAHAAKGPVRPLRRALQGLDPVTTASMFTNAHCIGEKKLNGEDCFILKLSADPQTLKLRSEGPVEIIRHVMFGYFSQKMHFLCTWRILISRVSNRFLVAMQCIGRPPLTPLLMTTALLMMLWLHI